MVAIVGDSYARLVKKPVQMVGSIRQDCEIRAQLENATTFCSRSVLSPSADCLYCHPTHPSLLIPAMFPCLLARISLPIQLSHHSLRSFVLELSFPIYEHISLVWLPTCAPQFEIHSVNSQFIAHIPRPHFLDL
jgi:hypothetical protein